MVLERSERGTSAATARAGGAGPDAEARVSHADVGAGIGMLIGPSEGCLGKFRMLCFAEFIKVFKGFGRVVEVF